MSEGIIVAIVTVVGGSCIGGAFALVQALLKLKFDKKVHEDNRKDKRSEDIESLRQEMIKGLDEREATGKHRFDTNSKSIEENTKAIAELTNLSKDLYIKIEKLTDSVNKSFEATNGHSQVMGEGVKSILYDKMTVVYDKCLSRCAGGAITVEEEANMEQLYNSYSGLGGNGNGEKMYQKACKMKTITKEEASRLDLKKQGVLKGKDNGKAG